MNINATLIAQAVVMIVFVAICWRYIYPPILSVMKEREKRISDGLEAAKKADDSLEEAKLAFVGDVLFNGSVGRTDFPKGDFDTLINSIKTKLWPLGNDVRFVPGHGPESTFGRERASNPFVADEMPLY